MESSIGVNVRFRTLVITDRTVTISDRLTLFIRISGRLNIIKSIYEGLLSIEGILAGIKSCC